MNADDDMERQLDEIALVLDATIRSVVRAQPGLEVDDLAERATGELLKDQQSGLDQEGPDDEGPDDEGPDDRGPDDEGPDDDIDLESFVDLEDLITDLVYAQTFELCDQHGPLIETADGKLLDLAHMVTDKVFTHRISATESQSAALDVEFDLWALSGCEVDRSPAQDGSPGHGSAERIDVSEDYYRQRWTNPGWRSALADGSTVAVSVDDQGAVTITVLDEAPAVDPEILESFRSAYELHCEATDRPPSSDLLAAEMLLDEPTVFDEPTAPLSDYAERLGLEVRRSVAAGEPGQWRILAAEHRMERLTDWFDPTTNLDALAVVHVAEQIAAGEPLDSDDPDDDEALDRVIESLSRRLVREAVGDEFFGDHDTFAPPVDPKPFLDLALQRAADGERRAAVHLMRSRMWQHAGDMDAMQAELTAALAEDPQSVDAADRLAWIASVRGDAATAQRLWQNIPSHPETDLNLAIIKPFTHSGNKPGRNEPCWCGSGRKYKKCHLGVAPVAALPERVPWLWRKAFGFVATTGIPGREQVADVAIARAGDPEDPHAIDAAFSDPLTMDLVLSEGGLLADFLDTFGELLPEDERDLAATWVQTQRSVHEITEAGTEAGVTLRDLRTGDMATLTTTSFPRSAHAGRMICARLVPDGVGHQIVGGVFEVPEDAGRQVLEVLDAARSQHSGTPIARWLARLERSSA